MIKDILLVQNYETYVLQNVLHIAFWQAVKKRVTDWVGDPNTIREKLPGKLYTQWGAFITAVATEDDRYLLANSSEYTGKGIAASDRDRMFKFFTKIDDLSEGLGLGLPLSKRHARNLGGDLYLDEDYHAETPRV